MLESSKQFSGALVDLCQAFVDTPQEQCAKRANGAHHALLLIIGKRGVPYVGLREKVARLVLVDPF